MVRYRGGGQAARSGPIWERYLGSPLPSGTYTVSVHVRRGSLLAQRSFEVLPDDISAMEPATRLRLLPQYFDLVDESANAAEKRTALGEPTRSAADSIVAAATTSTTTTAPRVPKLPRDQPDDPPQRHTRSDPEPHQKRKADPRPATHEEHAPKPSAVRKSALTFRAGAKDREWLRKDVSASQD